MPRNDSKESRQDIVATSTFLQGHFNLIEEQLLCLAEVASSAGHPVHKGTARESFIKQFLRDHIGRATGIGSGEVFDCERLVGDKANQIDVLVYDESFPKINFGGNDQNAFMVESIYTGMEIKSNLQKSDLEKALRCAKNLKSLALDPRRKSIGRMSGVPYYLIAYKGPSIETVAKWLEEIEHDQQKVLKESGPDGVSMIPRHLDGIFILGKGFILDVGIATSVLHGCSLIDSQIEQNFRWLVSSTPRNNLYCLYFLLNFHIHYNLLENYFKTVLSEYSLIS